MNVLYECRGDLVSYLDISFTLNVYTYWTPYWRINIRRHWIYTYSREDKYTETLDVYPRDEEYTETLDINSSEEVYTKTLDI